jgi:hypothetical protein
MRRDRQRAARVLVAIAAVLIPDAASASCPTSHWGYALLTPVETTLPKDASLLVGLQVSYKGPTKFEGPQAPATLFDKARLERNEEVIALSMEFTAAPSLVRLRPERSPGEGTWQLRGVPGVGETTLTFGDSAMGAPPKPPRMVSLALRRTRRGRGTTKYYEARLRPKPPTSTLLLMRWREKSGDEHPGPWTDIDPRGQAILPIVSRCVGQLPGTQATSVPSARAMFMAVDAFGRVSKPTRPRRVRQP